jgi:cobalamin biosynthesis protein CobD/CbiB
MMKAHEVVKAEEPMASRSHALPWMEDGVRRSYERKNRAMGVFASIVVIAFLLAVFLALPLLLLQVL